MTWLVGSRWHLRKKINILRRCGHGWSKSAWRRPAFDNAGPSEKGGVRMTTRDFARGMGIVFLAVGALGFVPGLKSPPPIMGPHVAFDGGFGLLLGLFPVNWLHNLVHLAIGVAGWSGSRTMADARRFARGLTIFY